jgi:hypothetical protein
MIQEGMEKECLDIVRGIRDRYSGENRNPWNEMECGSNYSRSMASYALLLSYSGFSYDMTKLEIGFAPLRDGSYFWSLDKAWGIFEQSDKKASLKVLYGIQKIQRLKLGLNGVKELALNGKNLPFKLEGNILILNSSLEIKEGEELEIKK